MVTTVIIVFLVTWSPYFFLKFLFLVNSDHPWVRALLLHQVVYITTIVPPVLNPLLYIYQFPAIREHFGRMKRLVPRAPRHSSIRANSFTVGMGTEIFKRQKWEFWFYSSILYCGFCYKIARLFVFRFFWSFKAVNKDFVLTLFDVFAWRYIVLIVDQC